MWDHEHTLTYISQIQSHRQFLIWPGIKIPQKSLMLLKFGHRQCLTDFGNGMEINAWLTWGMVWKLMLHKVIVNSTYIDHYSWITTFPQTCITSFKLFNGPQNVYYTPSLARTILVSCSIDTNSYTVNFTLMYILIFKC